MARSRNNYQNVPELVTNLSIFIQYLKTDYLSRLKRIKASGPSGKSNKYKKLDVPLSKWPKWSERSFKKD